MRQITLAFVLATCILSGCKKEKNKNSNCVVPEIVPFQAYSFPVWHPNGQIFGFNYTPLSGINANGTAPCIWYSYLADPDSTGFYIMTRSGSGLKRITDFNLFAPAWSPNGNWLAFNVGGSIFKMRYTGSDFDTANIIKLTELKDDACFNPSWSVNGDTIYFDSKKDAPAGTGFYSIWKMANDGTGKTRITQSIGIGDTRYPFEGSNNKIYFTKYVSNNAEIFSMDKNGSNQIQFSNNGFSVEHIKHYRGKIYFEANGIGVVSIAGNKGIKLISPAVTYDISSSGEIIYSKMEYDIMKYNKQIGTLWIMNEDGTNNRQLTFNNF